MINLLTSFKKSINIRPENKTIDIDSNYILTNLKDNNIVFKLTIRKKKNEYVLLNITQQSDSTFLSESYVVKIVMKKDNLEIKNNDFLKSCHLKDFKELKKHLDFYIFAEIMGGFDGTGHLIQV